GGGLGARPDDRGQRGRVPRDRVRPARRGASGAAVDGNAGAGPGHLPAGGHLTDRGAGRAPRRGGGGGAGGRRPRHGDGVVELRLQVGGGGRAGQPADAVPDVLDRRPGHDDPTDAAGQAGGRG